MNTSQSFFFNIVNNNAAPYTALQNIVGDYDKNSGLAAELYELSCNILGNTVTDNNDLSLVFGSNQNEFISDFSDTLNQSLRNATIGVAYSTFYSTPIDVCTHISTTIFSYNTGISSTFLSGQIYSFSTTGLSTNSNIIIPISAINFSGSFNKSWLFDVPMDFGVFGLNNFTGSYSGSNLIEFDYGWSFCNNSTNLIINLGYNTIPGNNFYIVTYWGNSDVTYINTSSTIVNNIVYNGTNNFVNSIAQATQNLQSPIGYQTFTTRKNFWNSTYPYSISLSQDSFIDTSAYLHTPNRLNYTLIDGVKQSFSSSNVFEISKSFTLNGFNTNFNYLYFDSATSGGSQANINLAKNYSSFFAQPISLSDFKSTNYNNVPLCYITLQSNPKKIGANIIPVTLLDCNQIIPSAYTKNNNDYILWKYFAQNIVGGKNLLNYYNGLSQEFLSNLDNFFAAYLFGYSYTDVAGFFSGSNLLTSQYTLKLFTKPYSFYTTPSLNFNQSQENVLYAATNIVSSKDFVNFTEGKLIINYNYNLPADTNFEIFKPISYVCNGVDPYHQGQGLALDYTLNMQFTYSNQNILQKTLHLMASKYLLTETEYNNRLASNQDVTGYFWLVDALNTQANTNSYSISSIREFYLYGYSALIPDLKDGVIRPILTKEFSPEDGTKYTYDQFVALLKANNPNITQDQINEAVQNYIDDGGEFYTIDTTSFSSNFNNLVDISLCAANYINLFNQNKYWNDSLSDFSDIGQGNSINNGESHGFVQFSAQNLTGVLLGTSIIQIPSVSIGYNCVVKSLNVLSIGSNQVPGNYQEYVLPSVLSSGVFTTEQPAVISYTILSSGVISSSSVKLINPGANFYYDFTYTVKCGIATGGTNATIRVIMDNTFNCTANFIGGTNSTLQSLNQTSTPNYGYNEGFYLNPNTFTSMGYNPSGISGQILILDSPTLDSFLIAQSGLAVGSLENFTNYNYITEDFSSINYTQGSDTFYLYDNEIINPIIVPQSLQGTTISYISLQCKLINLTGYVPSGKFKVVIYKPDINSQPDLNNIAAVSDEIDITSVSNNAFENVKVPITFTFYNIYTDGSILGNQQLLLYISIQQQVNGGILAIKGSFSGLSTSAFSISSTKLQNSNQDLIVYGNIGDANGYDLDLSYPISINISSSLTGVTTNNINLFLRKDSTINNTENSISLIVFTPTQNYTSNPISFNSLGLTYQGVAFTYGVSISTSLISGLGYSFNYKITNNQIYTSRDLSKYNYALGIGSTSVLNSQGLLSNFDFTFNKLFAVVSTEILGAFNFTDNSQFGLAKPNTSRVISPVSVIDGYWAFKGKNIYQPISIYPRSYLSYATAIGTSKPSYVYLGYSHDIYVAIGYNYLGQFNLETHKLAARPSWQTTWMARDNTNYKNFAISSVLIQSYFDTINYQYGTASTLIGAYGLPKNAIFEGTFNPGSSNNALPLTVQIGTSAGVQVYINNSVNPVIDTFSVISSASTSIVYSISTAVRQSSIYFKIYYYTLGTASISVGWNTSYPSGLTTLISSESSLPVNNGPINLNGGLPVDNLVFFNVLQTDTNNLVNYGYPPGDSFVIRSS